MRDFRKKEKLEGFSLIELVLAIGIFATISSLLVLLVVDATKTLDNTRTRANATNLIQEINTALVMIKDESWYEFAKHTDGGEKHIDFLEGTYQIADGPINYGDLSYSFSILRAFRNENGTLVSVSGIQDPHTRTVSISISWRDSLGREHTLDSQLYLNDWNTNSIVDTAVEDFTLGVHNQTYVENIDGGEVSLQKMQYSDWCRPTLSMLTYDLPRQGVATSISAFGETVLMGTGGNASGLPFIKAIVTEDPPGITIDDSFSSTDKVNDVFLLDEQYALLATDTGSKEVIILNLLTPIEEVGYFNIPVQTTATTVHGFENRGFVTHRNNLTTFDLSSNYGSRGQLETISLGEAANKTLATDIYVDEQYVYLTLSNHSNEFVIYEHTPTLQLVGQVDLGDVDATALFISEDKTRAYIGTKENTGHEFFILDISNKKTTYTVVSSLDLGGTSVNALVSIDKRVMIGGKSGQEYQVVDIEDELNPVQCGFLDIDAGVNDITLAKTEYSNYSYVLTGDANNELQIIRGGLGGGGPDGNGYLVNGEFLSQIFDTSRTSSQYYLLSVGATIPTDTFLKIQLRTSNYLDMQDSAWIGPDGTGTTYYEESKIYTLPIGMSGQYIQYRAIFESDTIQTPLIEEIIINYEQ